MSETPLLHVYGPHTHHDPSYLVGTRTALLSLQMALQKLLADAEVRTSGERLELFTADGEGYDLKIVLMPEVEMETLVMPYTSRHLVDPWQSEGANPDWPQKKKEGI